MAAAIGEMLLSTFLEVLFDKLTSGELLSLMRREGLRTLLKKWEKELRRINCALEDAEEKQLTGDAGVKLWLEDLRNLAYDIEDLLYDFDAQARKKKQKADSRRVSKTLLVVPSCFSPREFVRDQKMRSKIEDIDSRLQEIIKQKHSLSLRENDANQLASNRVQRRRLTTHIPESCFVGREKEQMEVLRLLIGEEEGINNISAIPKMIPIIGMGGVGKTALARQVYCDNRVAGYFDVKAWACASDDFDMAAITKRILENITGLSGEGNDLDRLQEKLWKSLSRKKFLIVLDDVWTEKYGEWTDFLKPFQAGAEGSVIVLTARNLSVASMAGAPAYHLKELPEDACLTLLAYHALGAKNFDHHTPLKSFGEKIVMKCKGLPLAVKMLGGLLRTHVDPQQWEAISKSRIWDQPEARNEILPSLKLSYHHLPPHLK
ncbi:putative disease resistance RPP13-like protein 1 [Eucalyptus grandis]|uniref:putative disease resistance RPP13-like protein 1 n=1 Tax=Eucalyptus grandis TaxID=71139 RepID=UPI00192F0DA4|nr:putative disease resistance RPP13-like protein 1 [Eucalyptus grandis]XP_039162282.1 putative disease resistance RPP13-like protein 1 [Eucalyptus grandis]